MAFWSDLPPGDLRALRSAADAACDRTTDEWKPEFGCALLPLPLPSSSCPSSLEGEDDPDDEDMETDPGSGSGSAAMQGQLALTLVCLDSWKCHIRRYGPGS